MKKITIAEISNYLSSDLSHSKTARRLRSLYLIAVLVMISWLIYFAWITIANPYPIEYREGASLVMTQFLLDGKNPFSLENQPLGMNNYGLGYNLLVTPFAAIFGNSLFVHRALTFLLLTLCFLIISRTLYFQNHDVPLALACGILIVIGMAGWGGLGANPTVMGACLFMAGVLIPFNRSFDRYGLLWSGLFSLLAFYTKPYYVLSFGIVASYIFIFVSKKKALLYGLFFSLAFLVMFFAVRFYFRLYFIDVLESNVDQATALSSYLYLQIKELGREYYPSLVVVFLVFLPYLAKFDLNTIASKKLISRANVLSLEHPLFSGSSDYFGYFFICSALAFLLILGPYPGSYMTYAYQLVMPPFFLWLMKKIEAPTRLAQVAMPLFVFNMIMISQILLNPAFLRQKDSKSWARLYQYVDQSKHILNSPILVSEMIHQGMLPVDSGQSEYYFGIRQYPDYSILGPDYDVIKAQGLQYMTSVRESVANAEFDTIMLTHGAEFYSLDEIGRHYHQSASVTVSMPQTHQGWTIDIWIPNIE